MRWPRGRRAAWLVVLAAVLVAAGVLAWFQPHKLLIAAVAAGLEQHPARLGVGRVELAQFPRLDVGVVDAAGQADRMGAVAGAADLGQPGGVGGWFGELVVLGQAPRVGGPSGPGSHGSDHARVTSSMTNS
jgi:hypothetical protein